ncbi:MAG: hypothetical protein ACJ8FY_11910 [Gemmataceae bacterium]
MRLTQHEIYVRGLEALRDRLGRAGMIRFLQQFETGQGDYARERREWVDRMTMDELRKKSAIGKSQTKRRKHS